MKNKLRKNTATDVNQSFLENINLWNIIGNSKNVQKLRILRDAYLNNKSEFKAPKISHALFVGKRASGRTTLAHAYALSLGCSEIFEAEASTLSMGGEDISLFLQRGDEFSAYLIHHTERLSFYCSSVMIPAIKENEIVVRDPMNRRESSRDIFDKLLMFSCSDIGKINPEIVKNVDVICFMEPLTDNELKKALEQRLDYLLGWEMENRDYILNTIVELANGDISLAMEMLSWSYRYAKSVGQDMITVKSLNSALLLMQ